MTEKKKRNIVICSLCGVLLFMVVGYAAFSTLLNIEGTTSISSNWNILITNVEEKNKVGEATTVDEYPQWEDLTAEFKTNLVSPGDSIEYDITIENKGNLNAELARIKVSEDDNEAIKFTTTGLEEGNILEASGSAVLTVKVEYSDEVTNQPNNLETNLKVTLDYVQQGHKSEWTPDDETASEMLIKKVTTQGDGLYSDTYESDRYVYKGNNPNNYITFNNETWRIISIESDGTIKIMRSSTLEGRAFDTTDRTTGFCYYSIESGNHYGCNVWANTEHFTSQPGSSGAFAGKVDGDSSIRTYLNTKYYNSITKNKTAIENHKFYYGAVNYYNSDFLDQLSDEKRFYSNDDVGLIQLSDFINTNSNESSCGNWSKFMGNVSSCVNTGWVDSTVTGKSQAAWSINPDYDGDNGCSHNLVWTFCYNGYISYQYANRSYGGCSGRSSDTSYTMGIIPSVYLKSAIQISGAGTQDDPYKITNYTE